MTYLLGSGSGRRRAGNRNNTSAGLGRGAVVFVLHLAIRVIDQSLDNFRHFSFLFVVLGESEWTLPRRQRTDWTTEKWGVVLELIFIMQESIAAIIPRDARYTKEEGLEVAESNVEALRFTLVAPEGGWSAGRCELGSYHKRGRLCDGFK